MADPDHTTSPTHPGRRELAGGAVLALLGATAAIPEANPDAKLIRLSGEFDALERRSREALDGPNEIEDEDEAHSAVEALREQQYPLLDRICALPCSTMEGAATLAASLVLWEAGEVELEDDPDANMNERLLSALLRGILGEG